jgi:transposase
LITIGVDAHKRLHVALAVDEAGHELGGWRGPNSLDGWQDLLCWSRKLDHVAQWGIEGAWGNGRGLAQHLVECGETVYEINPRWTAEGRRRARRQDKTDSLDARAVALCVRQEAPDLPRVCADDETAVLDLLTTQREAAVAESTRLRNQIHALLLQLDPQYTAKLPSLGTVAALDTLESYRPNQAGLLNEQRAVAVRMLAQRLKLAMAQARDLERQISSLTETSFAPLTRLCGINLLTAGTLAGILGPGDRFKTDAQLAAYAGASPLEASSAGRTRHRLNRGGNRRLNAVLYRIALTQAHHWPAARTYLDRRVTEGKTRREAHRCLRRYIIRAIWHLWQECLSNSQMKKSEAAA